MTTEYDYIEIIGRTHETYRHKTDQIMNKYYHKQETATVQKLLDNLMPKSRNSVIDLGTSVGFWLADYKCFGFKKVFGIDISEERAKKAQERGYDEVHVCNAYNMPFENESHSCVVSNDVLVHVLQDSDKLKIFKEVYRILKPGGVFIFNIPNAYGFGHTDSITTGYCRFNTLDSIKKMLIESKLKIKKILPSYYVVPRIAAHPRSVKFSSNIIFPITDNILTKMKNFSKAKVVYFGVIKNK